MCCVAVGVGRYPGDRHSAVSRVVGRVRVLVEADDAEAVVVLDRRSKQVGSILEHLQSYAPARAGWIGHASRLVEDHLNRDRRTLDAVRPEFEQELLACLVTPDRGVDWP